MAEARTGLSQAAMELHLRSYMEAVRCTIIREPQRSVIPRILDLGRQLLALQRYVAAIRDQWRGPAWVERRWVMTQQEFEAWRDSPAHDTQSRELREIVARFNAANPGCVLVPGSQFRSLDRQIGKWVGSPRVGIHAPTMLAAAYRKLADASQFPRIYNAGTRILPGVLGQPQRAMLALYPVAADSFAGAVPPEDRDAAVERFVRWLAIPRKHTPKIDVATPGLSDHGIGHAIDFQVLRGGKPVVHARSSADRWRATGFAEKLAAAMRPSRHFRGPLKSPDEPWHWTFDPTP